MLMRTTLKYYLADMPITVRRRANLMTAYMTGNATSDSSWLSGDDKVAFPFLPAIASAWKRAILAMVTWPLLIAFMVAISYLIGK
jgi:hypothetical protein